MNYGEVGRRRRVLLAGVGCGLEARRGFSSGSFPWVLGKVCPSLPTPAAIRERWRSLCCKSIPVWGSLFSGRAGWCTQSERGRLGVGWVLSATLEVCEGGTAASLDTWRGQARNGALPCFPHLLMPGWVLEMLVLGSGPTQHLLAFQSQLLTRAGAAALFSLLPCPLPVSCIPNAAATLLQHGWLGKTRGLSSMPSLPSVLVNV